MYELKITGNFKKGLKRIKKRGYKIELLEEIVEKLRKGEKLPEKYKDHELSGNHKGYRDCHIEPDWLLIYKIENMKLILTLVNTGTHSDLSF